jgi:hypothetical protein
MKIPSFHDGYFDGLWIGPNKLVHLFLRTVDDKSFTLALQGVEVLTASGVRQGNIILDLVVREAREITCSDMKELYGVGAETPQATSLLESTRRKDLQLLELNPSYGAEGLILFHSWEISERIGHSTAITEVRS